MNINIKNKSLLAIIGLMCLCMLSCKKNNEEPLPSNEDNNNEIQCPASLTDIDGNTYNVVKIGNQCWMSENLKTTRFKDNTEIGYTINNGEWMSSNVALYAWYESDEAFYGSHYGALYNWHAANSDKLCPDGWHVPTKEEFEALASYLGGTEEAGGKLKETDTIYWATPNTGATNESGFSARGGGIRLSNGNYFYLKTNGCWWIEAQPLASCCAWHASLRYDKNNLFISTDAVRNGFSVRCLKN